MRRELKERRHSLTVPTSRMSHRINRVVPVRSNSVSGVPSQSKKIERQSSSTSIESSKGRRSSWNNMGGDAVITSGSDGQSVDHDLRVQNQNLVMELDNKMKDLKPEFSKPSFFSKRFLGKRQNFFSLNYEPQGFFCVIVGMMLNLTLIFTVVSSPLRVAFSVSKSWYSDPFVDLIFVINFLKNTFVARISETGENVNGVKEKLLRYYQEGNFFTDALCALPVSLIAYLVPGLDVSYLMLFRILKVSAFECTLRGLRKSRDYRLRYVGIYVNDLFEMYVYRWCTLETRM